MTHRATVSILNGSTNPRIAVVLHNLGGPTSEDAVRPFLKNLFLDPDIIKFGGDWRQKLLATLISNFRAPKVAKKYAEINACPTGCTGHAACPTRTQTSPSTCCSPINPLTERQREALEARLQVLLPASSLRVFTAMRYWKPSIAQTLQDVQAFAPDIVVHLPLYPQFSWTTSGSSFRSWNHHESALPSQPKWLTFQVKHYHLDPRFIQVLDERIDAALEKLPENSRGAVHLVFSAHGTPISEVESGDPYTLQVQETVEAVMQRRRLRLGREESFWLGFQSRVGPAKWTQPNTEDLALRLVDYGVRNLVIIPVAFVTDHIETLVELNDELREVTEAQGLHHLVVTEGLNDTPLFIDALAQQVLGCLGRSLPMVGNTSEAEVAQV